MPFFSRTSNATIFRGAPFGVVLPVDMSHLLSISYKSLFLFVIPARNTHACRAPVI
jgi:hypothetical protein